MKWGPGSKASLEPRLPRPDFTPIFLQGCEIKSGRGRPGFKARARLGDRIFLPPCAVYLTVTVGVYLLLGRVRNLRYVKASKM